MKTDSYTVSPEAADALAQALAPFRTAGVSLERQSAGRDFCVTVTYPDPVAARVEQVIAEWYVDYIW